MKKGILINTVTLLGCLILYIYVFWSLDRGISSDEGWYLNGYVYPIFQSGISDFHVVIRSVFSFLDFENVLGQRYFYFFFSLIVIGIFSQFSYLFLRLRFSLKVNRIFYTGSIFLVALFSYTFASPLLYYDTLQYLLFLLIFSLLFVSEVYPKLAYACFFGVGFLLLYTITNYLPSGLLLSVLLLGWLFLVNKLHWRFLSFYVLGFLFSTIIYHFCIHSLIDYLNYTYKSFSLSQNVASDSLTLSSHSSKDLISGLFSYLTWTVFFFFFFLVMNGLSSWLSDLKVKKTISIIISSFPYIVALLLAFRYRNVWVSNMFLIPIAFLLSDIFYARIKRHRELSFSLKEMLFVVGFLLLPIVGIFGTNQPLQNKTMMFLVFWLIGIYILYARYRAILRDITRKFLLPFTCLLVPVLFSYYGFFTRCHNYYGIRKASFVLEDSTGLKNIKLVKYQKLYIEHLNRILKEHHFKDGDVVLAFEVDLMAIFALGAAPDEHLYYTHSQMINQAYVPQEKINYILLSKRAEIDFADYMRQFSHWNFPEAYKRIEIGKFAENMPDEYISVLYVMN